MNTATDNQPAELEELPATFTDREGREWEPRLDYVKLRKIRDVATVDLGNVEQMGRTWAVLISDDLKALDTIWLAISDGSGEVAAGDSSVTRDDWFAAMDGELLDGARLALGAAIDSFTQPLKRKILRQGMNAVEKAYRLMITETEDKLEAEIPAVMERALGKARGKPATKSAASSASSTKAGHSAKRTGC